jgi:hypothetical protein
MNDVIGWTRFAARLLDVCGTTDSFSANLTGFAKRERFSVNIVLNGVHDE